MHKLSDTSVLTHRKRTCENVRAVLVEPENAPSKRMIGATEAVGSRRSCRVTSGRGEHCDTSNNGGGRGVRNGNQDLCRSRRCEKFELKRVKSRVEHLLDLLRCNEHLIIKWKHARVKVRRQRYWKNETPHAKTNPIAHLRPAHCNKIIEVKVYWKWVGKNVPNPEPTRPKD
nr:hypothetical protein [Tanacetum cinerariifolium]